MTTEPEINPYAATVDDAKRPRKRSDSLFWAAVLFSSVLVALVSGIGLGLKDYGEHLPWIGSTLSIAVWFSPLIVEALVKSPSIKNFWNGVTIVVTLPSIILALWRIWLLTAKELVEELPSLY